jgi:hypothetical protein
MTVATRRFASLVSAVALVVSGTAGAQVTIHVTTTQNATATSRPMRTACVSQPAAPISSRRAPR